MYELAAFRQLQFLTVNMASVWLMFFASLTDNETARCLTRCGIVAIGPQSPKYQVDMHCFSRVLVCVSMRVCAQFAKIMDLIEVNGGITRESVCVST